MSSDYVRRMVRQWITDPAIALPFYETVNEDQDPREPMWFTLAFDPYGVEPATYCGTVREDGELRLVFFGEPGQGDAALIPAAEQTAALIAGHTDPGGRLVLEEPSPPFDYGDLPFAVEISIPYQFYT